MDPVIALRRNRLAFIVPVALLASAGLAVPSDLGRPQEFGSGKPQEAAAAAGAEGQTRKDSAVPQDLLDGARQAESKRDWKAALAAWQAVLAIAPAHRAALAGASRCQLRLDDYRAALAAAEKAVAADPADGEALVAQAAALMRAGELERALQAFGRAAEKAPESAAAHLGLGRLLIASGETAQGIAELTRAHDLAPDDPEVLLRWAGTLSRREEASAALQRWLDLTPEEDPARRESVRSTIDFYRMLGETPVWVLESRPARGETELRPISRTPGALDGYVVEIESPENAGDAQAARDSGDEPVKTRRLRCLLDTGASGLFLSARASAKIETKPLSRGAVYGGGGTGRHEMSHVLIPSLTLAGMTFRNVPAVVATGEVDPLARYDGILGPDALESFRLILDLPNRKLRFEDPPSAAGAAAGAAGGTGTAGAAGAAGAVGGAGTTGTAGAAGAATRQKVLAPAARAIRIWKVEGQLLLRVGLNDGASGLMMVDTGASRSVLSLAAADGLRGISRQRREGRTYGFGGTLDRVEDISNLELTVAGLPPRRLSALGMDLSLRSRLVETEIGGYLGLDVLRDYALEFEPGLTSLTLRRKNR